MSAVRFVFFILIAVSTVEANAARIKPVGTSCSDALVATASDAVILGRFRELYAEALGMRSEAARLSDQAARISRPLLRSGEGVYSRDAARFDATYSDLLAQVDALRVDAASKEAQARALLQRLKFAQKIYKQVVEQLLAPKSNRVSPALRRSLIIARVLYGADLDVKLEKSLRKELTGGVRNDDLTVAQSRAVNRRMEQLRDAVSASTVSSVTDVSDALESTGGRQVWSVLQMDLGGGQRPDELLDEFIANGREEAEAVLRHRYALVPDVTIRLHIGHTLGLRAVESRPFIFQGVEVTAIPPEAWAYWASEPSLPR